MTAVRLRSVAVPWACLGLVLLALTTGCGKPSAATPPPQASSGPVPTVTTVKPERRPLSHVIEQPAFVEAYEETPLFARIAGYVQKLGPALDPDGKPLLDRDGKPRPLDIGDRVAKDQVLAELWVPEVEEELRQKQALVAQAEAEVEQAAAALEAAAANVATAQAMVHEAEAGRKRAEANYERWKNQYLYEEKLFQRKALFDEQSLEVTRQQKLAAEAAKEEVEAKVHAMQAAAKESEAKRNKARADLMAAKAKVQVAQAEAARCRALLEYSKVRAPYEGIITSRNIHTGHYLTGTGTRPLFVIARTDTVRIVVDVPEAEAMYISDGVPVRIRFPVIKDEEFEGTVTRSSWSLDAKARTLRTEIDLPNPQGRLRPGMYAYVTFLAESRSGFTLPVSAVVMQADQPYCYLVENGKAVRTPVKVGVRHGQLVQVLKKQTKPPAKAGEPGVWEDFTGDEQVVLSNPGSLSDGQIVTVGGRP
ncbi:MAG TPA: efflux RND transporter periplasmic adaptor subunit [Gemmataceae bacterium]|nr:efflux RND transporter periplasmic adaptor subunit [Gemmataceae bacterium]